MNRDEIIRLAKEAGISKPWDQEPVKWETLEEFANLVSISQVEKLARMCEEIPDDEHYFGVDYADMLRDRWDE